MSPNIEFNSSAVNAGDCISDGWSLIQPNYWLFLGMSFLGLIIGGCIPCVSIFLAGPVMVGIFYTLFTQMRGQPVEFGMMFKGFERFVPAMVVGIISSLPEIAGEGLRITARFADFGNRVSGNQSEFVAQSLPNFALSGGIIILIVCFAIVAFIISIAWKITFIFALPLIADRNLEIGDALKLSARAGWANWSGLLVLFIFQFLVALVGVLLLCVGVFFVIPIIQASTATAYRQVFPDNQLPFNNEPPRPDAYGETYGTAQQ
ncbi:MAG TPA: hypothetical protein VF556_08835 [Pyrinomonadaceae bacterium]|jgi:hypothetical protein